MKRSNTVVWSQSCAAVCTAIGLAGAAQGAPQLIDIGVPAGAASAYSGGLSADGTTVVGSEGQNSVGAFRWTNATGNVNLGTPPGSLRAFAGGVNSDGSVVVGNGASQQRAFRWTLAGGMQVLDLLPGLTASIAAAVSGDGAIVVGQSSVAGVGRRAVWWSADGAAHDLGTGVANSAAFAISGDGSVIVGLDFPHPFRWTSAGGVQQIPISAGFGSGFAYSSNEDGSKIVGTFSKSDFSDSRAWLWTPADGVRLLPRLYKLESATAISADGSLIGGIFQTPAGGSRSAIWHPVFGGMALNDYLPRLGVDMDGWSLGFVAGISADGTRITGSGLHNGNQRAWLLTGFTPINLCPADFNHDWVVEDADFVQFAAGYEILDCADPSMTLWCPADLDHDGFVDDADFVIFVQAYDELLCE